MSSAAALRDRGFGDVVTYSPKVFIPLTELCRDVCHYCTYAKTPRRVAAPFLSPERVLEIARAGREAGCREALFTLGDKPELRYRAARDALERMGYATTLDYLAAMAELVRRETGLLPHLNAGIMTPADYRRLRTVAPSMGLMLESASPRLAERGGPHFGSPDKRPEVRIESIRAAGDAAVPFTTGILIGIGETRAERIDSLLAIRRLHEQHGHIQEIIVQNFVPKPGTKMADAPAPDREELLWTIAIARAVFGPHMSIQAPPNLNAEQPEQLILAGHQRLGRRVAGHAGPREPGIAVAAPRRCVRDRARGQAAGAAADGLSALRARARPLGRCRTAQRRARALPMPKVSRATTAVATAERRRVGGRRRRRPAVAAADVARTTGWSNPSLRLRSRAPARANRCRSTTSVACSPRAATTFARYALRRTNCAGERSATTSPMSSTATSTTRTCVSTSASSVRSRKARPTSICGARRTSSTSTRSRAHGGSVAARRHRGVPAGRDTSVVYRAHLSRHLPRGEGGGAGHSRARILPARSDARRGDARPVDRAVPAPAQGRRPRHAARHGRRDTRRRGARVHLPGQADDTRVARRHRHRARVGLRRPSTIMFGHMERSSTGRATCWRCANCSSRPAASPNSSRCRTCTWKHRCIGVVFRGPGRPTARRS